MPVIAFAPMPENDRTSLDASLRNLGGRPPLFTSLAAIERELELEFAGTAAMIRHRLGTLVVGDASVAVVAVAAHRREALAACDEGIERVKARVPVWKREHGPGRDAAWVDPRPGRSPAADSRRR